MAIYTRFVGVKFSEREYEVVEKKAKEKEYISLSAFIRDSILENNGVLSKPMKKQLYDLRWEINKIGTNINQATKRINSGFGSVGDVKLLLENQNEIKQLLEKYIEEIEEKWQ